MATQRGQKWQANAYLNGKRVRPTFDTKAEAEAFERNPSVDFVRPLIGELFRHGSKFLWDGKRNGYEANLIAEELIRRLGEDEPVATITAARIQDLIIELRVAGNSGARINRKLSALRMLLRHCYEREAITQIPVFPKPQSESNGRERFLTRAEADALLSYLDRRNWNFARFLLNTGARIGEVLALRWEDVGEQSITFRWSTTKSKQTRTVGLNTTAREAISLGRELDWPSPWDGIEYAQFRRAFDRAKHLAGLGDDPEVVPHILRHTHASWLVQRGVPIQVVSKLLGHSSITITMRYAKLAPDNLLNVTEILE
jgi:integrase